MLYWACNWFLCVSHLGIQVCLICTVGQKPALHTLLSLYASVSDFLRPFRAEKLLALFYIDNNANGRKECYGTNLYIKSASGYQPEKGVAIPLTLDTAYKLNCVCNAGLLALRYRCFICIPHGERTKINYKLSLTPYLVFVKWYNTIYRYFGPASYNMWFMWR